MITTATTRLSGPPTRGLTEDYWDYLFYRSTFSNPTVLAQDLEGYLVGHAAAVSNRATAYNYPHPTIPFAYREARRHEGFFTFFSCGLGTLWDCPVGATARPVGRSQWLRAKTYYQDRYWYAWRSVLPAGCCLNCTFYSNDLELRRDRRVIVDDMYGPVFVQFELPRRGRDDDDGGCGTPLYEVPGHAATMFDAAGVRSLWRLYQFLKLIPRPGSDTVPAA
jgi:hypothetical protein